MMPVRVSHLINNGGALNGESSLQTWEADGIPVHILY